MISKARPPTAPSASASCRTSTIVLCPWCRYRYHGHIEVDGVKARSWSRDYRPPPKRKCKDEA